MNRSGAVALSASGRFQRHSTRAKMTNETVLRAKTTPAPVRAFSTPATAGPTARARFMLIAPSAEADASWLRGTSSGFTACQAGPTRA